LIYTIVAEEVINRALGLGKNASAVTRSQLSSP
jgi:hypothetical protein